MCFNNFSIENKMSFTSYMTVFQTCKGYLQKIKNLSNNNIIQYCLIKNKEN